MDTDVGTSGLGIPENLNSTNAHQEEGLDGEVDMNSGGKVHGTRCAAHDVGVTTDQYGLENLLQQC